MQSGAGVEHRGSSGGASWWVPRVLNVFVVCAFLVVVMSGKHFKNNQNFNDFVLLLFLAFILTFYFLHVLVLGLVGEF